MSLFQKLKDWNEENLRMEQEQGTAQKAQREAAAVKHTQEKQAQLEAAAAKIKELEEQAAIQNASLAPAKTEGQKTPLPDDKVSRGQQQATQSQPQTYKSEQEQRYVSIIGPHLKQTTPLPDDDQSRAIKKQPQTYKSLLEKKQEQATLKKAPLETAQAEGAEKLKEEVIYMKELRYVSDEDEDKDEFLYSLGSTSPKETTKAYQPKYNPLRIVIFSIAAFVVFLIFDNASMQIERAGRMMWDIRSVGGNSIDESYFHEVGTFCYGIAGAVFGFGIFCSVMLFGTGIRKE